MDEGGDTWLIRPIIGWTIGPFVLLNCPLLSHGHGVSKSGDKFRFDLNLCLFSFLIYLPIISSCTHPHHVHHTYFSFSTTVYILTLEPNGHKYCQSISELINNLAILGNVMFSLVWCRSCVHLISMTVFQFINTPTLWHCLSCSRAPMSKGIACADVGRKHLQAWYGHSHMENVRL